MTDITKIIPSKSTSPVLEVFTQSETKSNNDNNKNNSTKKSCTTILCELTRLKSQQKYLELNQIKLNSQQFDSDIDEILNEIDQQKTFIDNELTKFCELSKRDINDMWIFVNAIKLDVFNNDENFKNSSLTGVRERILGINTHINKLIEKNEKKIKELREEFAELEKGTKLLIK